MNHKINWKKIFKLLDNDMNKKDYLTIYQLIFTECSKLNFDRYSFFNDFIKETRIWLKESSNHVKIELNLPWSLVCNHLGLLDLYKVKTLNQEFNNGIQINLLSKFKQLNNLLIYFYRTNLIHEERARILLRGQGLEHLYSKDFTINKLLIQLFKEAV